MPTPEQVARQNIDVLLTQSGWILQPWSEMNLSTGREIAVRIAVSKHVEQRRSVAEVERRLSVVQELEGTLAANLARAQRLRQAILKRAFGGKLV